MSKRDWCSWWPDGDWTDCCRQHDRQYGTAGKGAPNRTPGMTRRRADAELRACVAAKGHPVVAWIMWAGVRLFGQGGWA